MSPRSTVESIAREVRPLLGAGAIVVADCLVSDTDDACGAILALARRLGGARVGFDEDVAASERDTGFRNASLAHLMKSFGNLENPVGTTLDAYFHQCSLTMSCTELARQERRRRRHRRGGAGTRHDRRVVARARAVGQLRRRGGGAQALRRGDRVERVLTPATATRSSTCRRSSRTSTARRARPDEGSTRSSKSVP